MTRNAPTLIGTFVGALAAAAVCAACAPVPAPEPVAGISTQRACFFASAIDGYNDAPDGRTGNRFYVDTGPNDRWLLETFGACPELDWTQRIGIDTRGVVSLCTGDTATVFVPRSFDGPPDRCSARVLGKSLTR
jgi:hypothetical protein